MNPLPIVLITGASSGIGLELAHIFAARHYELILVARDRAKLERVAAELHQKYLVPVRAEVCDLSDGKALDEFIEKLGMENQVVDILVNNAGFGVEGPFSRNDWRVEREMIDVNVVALVRLTKAILPQMLARRTGRILQVSSTAAFQPGPFLALYFASKAFVLSFSEALSAELRGSGVTVTALCPGPTHTEFAKRLGTVSSLFSSGIPIANATAVAEFGYRSLMSGKRVAVYGVLNRALVHLTRFTPGAFVLAVMARLLGKRPPSGPGHSKNLPSA